MRIAHATDIHWFCPPSVDRLFGKRLLGTANLYLRGRRHDFDEAVQTALVDKIVSLEPDMVAITGDLTAQALPAEFAKARAALQPVLDRFPTFVIPGNHDVYTTGARDEARIRSTFDPWMFLDNGPVSRFDLDGVTVLGLDPNRPTFLDASGELPAEQLTALRDELAKPDLADRRVVLCVHYPVVDRHGEVYDNGHHGLINANALIEVLENAPKRPDMILHGHEHHGFRASVTLSDTAVPTFDCGSSGYAFMPKKKRAGAMCLYTLSAEGIGVERFLYDGEGFSAEPGGAYATGR